MKIQLLLPCTFICLLTSLQLCAQQSFWSKPDNSSYSGSIASLKESLPEKYLVLKIEHLKLRTILQSVPLQRNNGGDTKGVPFSMPLPDGTMLSTSITESPIWEAENADQFSNVKTYILTDPVTKTLQGRIAVTAEGISGIIFSEKGTVYINPISNNQQTHLLYYTKDAKASMLPCEAKADETLPLISNKASKTNESYSVRRTYRLAIATTAEYTSWAGGQDNARMYIAIAMNNVLAIYERDLNIGFSIMAPNSIIFTNAATDPYPGGNVYLDDAATNANQVALDNIIGTANYDLGMVFNRGWNRGYVPPPFAYVCKAASKGKSATGTLNGVGLNPVAGPQGLNFDFTVAHEMAHQFGAPHSYASNTGICAGFATPSSAFEPGSGSTIMGYAGYPDCNTYTSYGENYFHAGTIAIIQSYVNGAGNCVEPVITANTLPVVSVAATSYNVPVSTPFTLSATGTDADGNTLLYNWEQMDVNFLTPSPPKPTNTAGPNFRSYAPSPTGNTRTFPRIYDIASGISPAYEVLPSVTRTMNFRITARDQSSLGGGIGYADVAVNFNNSAGPFTVTSQQSVVTWTANGSNTQTITWNVASTNAAPVNCTAVNILFSVDGGITYPYTLVSNTNNDGSEIITVPNISTASGRVKVEAVNNIFFNINAANITVVSTCLAEGTKFTTEDSISAAEGSTELNLSLSPQYGTAFTPSGTITSANPSTFLTIYNNDVPSCATYGFEGSSKYSIHPFVVTSPGNYTFTPSTYGLIYNLYHESFDPAFPCKNFIASNTIAPPTTIRSFVSVPLSPGKYVLVAGTFSATFPTLPHNYSVAVTDGSIYSNPPNPGAAFSYSYIVVDKATNLIKSIALTADLSNSLTYPGGTGYTVYGLSYSNSSPSLETFVGGSYTNLQNAIFYNADYCGNIAKNVLKVNVMPQYTFTGSGNWSDAANWLNNIKPPDPLPASAQIVINPAGTGECVLDVPISFTPGIKLIVSPGKTVRVL